jgi:pSer/pThr/pTyr-binding forkhead associated (FHA) protein
MAKLICVAGPNLGDYWELHLGTTTIGRHAANNVVLHDTKVSRNHAILKFEDDIYILEDLGSLNGTQVYGKRVSKSVVSLETPIQLGNTILFLTRKDAKDAALQHVEAVGDDLFLKHKSKEEVMSGILSELAVAKAKEPESKQGVLSKLLKSKEKSQKVPLKKKDLGMGPRET